jgi:hypothetical protein
VVVPPPEPPEPPIPVPVVVLLAVVWVSSSPHAASDAIAPAASVSLKNHR